MSFDSGPVIQAALEYVKGGLSVVPIKVDGSKQPPPGVSWKWLQEKKPSPYRISQLFRGEVGIAVIGGKVSGNLEIIDFDRRSLIEPWTELVEVAAPGLLTRITRIKTPKGGAHFYYRCPEIEGNEKLAQEPPSIDEKTGEPKPNTLIETRGEGGYVLAPKSPPGCHPTGRTYEYVSGPPLFEISTITPGERKILLDAARSFNKWTPTIVHSGESGRTRLPGDPLRPGDDWNQRASWDEILTPHGWSALKTVGESVQWRRPGKSDGGMSATTGHCGDNFYVFSSNAAPFVSNTAYTKFAAFAILEYGGDFAKAAKALGERGYGEANDPSKVAANEKEFHEFEEAFKETQAEDASAARPTQEEDPGLATPQKDYKKKKDAKKAKDPKDIYFDGRTFLPEPLALEISSRYKFIATPIGDDGLGARVYVYRDGVFKHGAESLIVDESRAVLGNLTNSNRVGEVVKNVRIARKVEYFNLNAKAKDLINVRSGMLNWRSGKLSPHDPSFLSTFQIDTDYDPDAKAPELDRFLEAILPADEIPVIEEFLGYLLIPDTSFNKCLVVVGEGGNGKSTLMDVAIGFLGEGNVTHYSLHHISEEKFSVAGLFGSLANFYDELQTKQIRDTATFKIITGGSPLKAEDKGKSPFSFRPFCRLVFSANEMPRADDRSQAYFDRFVFIQLPNRIRGTRSEIREYAKVLLSIPGVRPALLNRAISGLRRLMNQGKFSASTSSSAAIEEYRRECNSAYDFLKEHCTFEDPTGWISKRDLYDRYRAWCGDNTRHPMSSRGFGKSLEAMNVRPVRHGEARGWLGISWLDGISPKMTSDEIKMLGTEDTEYGKKGKGDRDF